MKFLIYACEDMYQGYHGINDYQFVEAEDVIECDDIGNEMSGELIESYTWKEVFYSAKEIVISENDLSEDYDFDEDEANFSDELDRIYDELVEENKIYYVHKLKAGYNKLSDEALYSLFSEYGYDGFVQKYCED